MKPRILISGSENGLLNYVNAVRAAGGEPCACYLPPADGGFDALLLAGGGDVEPRRFGQENTASQNMDPARDAAELALVARYLEAGKPILGICRGQQILNVALGGDLIQDIGDFLRPFHLCQNGPKDRVHAVFCCKGSFLYNLYGGVFSVNSAHHQAVNRLGTGLKAAALAESGLIEALEHEHLPVRSVQWHPERMSSARRRPDTADGAFHYDWLIRAAPR